MSIFDLGDKTVSYRRAAAKIITGAAVSAAIVLFRAFVKLPEGADGAAGTVCAFLLIGFIMLAVLGAAEAVNVSSNRKRESARRGEAFEPLTVKTERIYELLEIADIVSAVIRRGGETHTVGARSDYARNAAYSYNKRYFIDSEEFSGLEQLTGSGAAALLGLDDPDFNTVVIDINGMDPREFLGK